MSPLRFDTGRLCLDLVATRTGRPEEERLRSPDRLAEWLYGTGLVPRGPGDTADPGLVVDEDWLTGFRGLRAAVCRVVAAEVAGERPAAADVAELNATALAAPPAPRAVTDEGGALIRTLAAPPEPAGLLGAVPGRRRPADRPAGPYATAPLRGRELLAGVSGHLARPAPPLVQQ